MRLVGWMTPYVGGHYGQCPLYQSPISRYPPVNTSPFVLAFLSFYLFILPHSPGKTYDQPPGHNFLSANSASRQRSIIGRVLHAQWMLIWILVAPKNFSFGYHMIVLVHFPRHMVVNLIPLVPGATLLSNALKFVERRWSEISNLAYYY